MTIQSEKTTASALLQVDDDFDFDLIVKRSPRRRTLEINVRNGRVQLMLPSFVSDSEGADFLRRKWDWVRRALKRQRLRAAEIVEKSYQQGELFSFLGKQYVLDLGIGCKQVTLTDDRLCVLLPELSADSVRQALWQWYREQARSILTEKTNAMVEKLGVRHEGVRLRMTKTKWGHCTASGIIQYNWAIVAAPEAIIDYLVAHEVSHLIHLNHSADFWQVVESLCPDYRTHRSWLRSRGHTITV